MTKLLQFAQNYEIPLSAQKPAWAEFSESELLFSVAWFSDFHLADDESEMQVKAALKQVRDEIKPELIFITGDNCGQPLRRLPKENPEQALSLKRQLWLKDFLDREINCEYFIIPGDNWPWDFEKVFGAEKRSFTYAGFHFLFTTPDEQAMNKEGCSIFHQDSLQWMEKQIAANKDKPSFLILHEPVYPPTFLDAPILRTMLDNNPQIHAVLSGHLHLDLEFSSRHWQQFCCPAIGRSHNPGFKILYFTKEKIIINSSEWQKDTKTFACVEKWQKIDIPEEFQGAIETKSATEKFAVKNIQEMPPKARIKNEALTERFSEISNNNMSFLMEMFFSKMLKPPVAN